MSPRSAPPSWSRSAWPGIPLLALAALPVVGLLQRSLSHVKLVSDARTDSKTGLLNAATWERESAAEVARAVRTQSPLAIAMVDIDKFKVVNDTYGHLVGDQVLKEIANTLNTLLRDYDLAGRFGGEEFSLLLPQTRAVDAFRIAERVRANIASLSIIAAGTTGGERVQVTVSIGVAALDSGSKRELSELVAAADAALYRAKAGGRDQVQMISTTRGLSAVSGPGTGAGAAAPTTARTRRAYSAGHRAPDQPHPAISYRRPSPGSIRARYAPNAVVSPPVHDTGRSGGTPEAMPEAGCRRHRGLQLGRRVPRALGPGQLRDAPEIA